jgi:hypothetical protein
MSCPSHLPWLIIEIILGEEFKFHFTVAARSKAWIVFSNTGVVGSNPPRGMDVCVYSVFALSRVYSSLAEADPPSKGSLRLSIWLRNRKTEPKAHHGLWCSQNSSRREQVRKPLIMQFSPTSYHFIPLRSKYSLQHLRMYFNEKSEALKLKQ